MRTSRLEEFGRTPADSCLGPLFAYMAYIWALKLLFGNPFKAQVYTIWVHLRVIGRAPYYTRIQKGHQISRSCPHECEELVMLKAKQPSLAPNPASQNPTKTLSPYDQNLRNPKKPLPNLQALKPPSPPQAPKRTPRISRPL